MENEKLTTVAQVQDALDELVQANGFWASELTLLGCAHVFHLELDDEDIEDVTAVLFDDDYGDTELNLVAETLSERVADPEVLTEGDLAAIAERFGVDEDELAEELALLLAD